MDLVIIGTRPIQTFLIPTEFLLISMHENMLRTNSVNVEAALRTMLDTIDPIVLMTKAVQILFNANFH